MAAARALAAASAGLAALFAAHNADASFDLVNLGTNSFTIDSGVGIGSYEQTGYSLVFRDTVSLGNTQAGTFAERDWSGYESFGLRMTLTGENPELPFTVEFLDVNFESIAKYQGNTTGLSFVPTVAMLGLSVLGNENFSQVVGMQFTWDGEGSIDTSLTEVVGFGTPATGGLFIARAPGGFIFLTSTNEAAGIRLTPAGAWSTLSDSNAKTAVSSVDHRETLRKISELPVSAWAYKHQQNRRHVGPMAQDFHRAFGLGPDDKFLTAIDLDGVALSALKGLIEVLRDYRDRSAAQARRIAELEADFHELREMFGDNLPPAPQKATSTLFAPLLPPDPSRE